MNPLRAILLALAALFATCGSAAQTDDLPRTLFETGLYDGSASGRLHPQVLEFSPQYPLWSDAADKQRWIRLPPGASIDAGNPDAWEFPVGTKLWKSFSHGGKPVETRFIERLADGQWRFATYVWKADGSAAELAPARGLAALPVAAAPGGRYSVPGRGDCLACHGGATVPILGFSALQLSATPRPKMVDGRGGAGPDFLRELVQRGAIRGLPARVLTGPQQVAAASQRERAALGYLHANCSHCHHPNPGRVPVRLNLMQSAVDPQRSAAEVIRSMVETVSRYQAADSADSRVVVAGDAAASVLIQRMRSRDPRVQMPPLGTRHIDADGLALLADWINHDLAHRKEP